MVFSFTLLIYILGIVWMIISYFLQILKMISGIVVLSTIICRISRITILITTIVIIDVNGIAILSSHHQNSTLSSHITVHR